MSRCWLAVMLLMGCPKPVLEETSSSSAGPPLVDGTVVDPLQRAFEPDDDFGPVPEPTPLDWLATHEEEGQSVADYKDADFEKPAPGRRTIYILPIGGLEAEGGPPLDKLKAYATTFFDLPVEVLPQVTVGSTGARTRSFEGRAQLNAEDVLKFLITQKPDDAFCLLGLTMTDLFPGEKWNFVFGYASPKGRVGVFSFRRYDPRFESAAATPNPKLVLRRGFKVMTHEIGHMFGLKHCIDYRCLMNGANHAAELDQTPLHLCPVCLEKMHVATQFDPAARYDDLAGFYAATGLDEGAEFVRHRAAFIRGK